MSIDITALSISVSSTGITEASKALGGLTTSAGNAEKRIDSLVAAMKALNAMGGSLASVTTATSAAANANAQLGAAAKVTSQALLQQKRDVELYNQRAKEYATAQAEAVAMNKAFDAAAKQVTATVKTQNSVMREAHDLARGLSGSLGALWLTYGSFIGMGIGVAIGASLKGIITVGKDVENTLEGLRIKGQETVESVDKIRDSVMKLGTGLYGPQEVAKAFETMILAGKTAKEALSGISDALNLATVGGTSIEKSAYTIVQVGTALGYAATNYSRIADVIAMTAAASMSSVESLSEAFKSGSVVGKLYGVTLVDIGVSLAALSNLGIQGSAAGTSLKNFYKELSSNAEKVKTTLAGMKLVPADFKDAQGNYKNLLEVVETLATGLGRLTLSQQKLAIANLSNERGMKTAIELLDLYKQKSGDTSTVLVDLRKKIDESYGFAAIGAAQMSLTVDAQFKSVANTLKTTFLGAFQAVSPELSAIATKLKAAFGGGEFKSLIETLALAVAKLTLTLVENGETFYNLLRAVLAFKAASFMLGLLVGIAEGFVAVKTAMIEARVASIAFQASLGLIGLALAATAAAFVWYATKKDEATTGTKAQAAITYSGDYAKALETEAERLTEQLRLLKEGKNARDAETESIYKQQTALAQQKGFAARIEAETRMERASMAITPEQLKISEDIVKRGGRLTAAAKEYKEAQQNLIYVNNQVDTGLKRIADGYKLVMDSSKALEDERRRQEAANKPKETGTGVLPEKINRAQLNDEYNEALTKIHADIDAAKREFDNLEKLVQSKVKSGAMTEMDALTQVSEAHIKSYKKQADAYQRMLNVIAPENKLARQAEISASMIAMQDKEAETANRLAEGMAVLYAKADQQRLDRRVKTLEALGKFEEAAVAKGAKLFETELRLNKAALATAEASVKTDFVSDNTEIFRRIAYYKEQIKIAEEEIAAIRFEGKERDAKHAKEKLDEYLKDWKKIDNQIRDDLTDAILDGGGKGFKRLIRDMERAFAKMILRPILDPISGGIADIATGKPGSLLTNTASSFAGTALGGIAGVTTALGEAVAEFQTGFSGLAGTLGNAITPMSQLGSAFAAAVPWIAAAGVAYKVWTTFFEDGPESNTRLNFTSNNTPGNISINERGNEGKTGQSYIDGSGASAFGTFGLSSTFWMNGAQKTVQDFITNVTKTDDVLAKFLTSAEQLSVIKNITGKTFVANTGAEGADPNATGQLDDVFARRLAAIMEGVETGLSSLTEGFKGTAQELASEAAALLQFRQALAQSGEAVFGVKVTLQEIAALKLPTEATSAALTRVTSVFNVTNTALAIIGKTSEEAFGKIGLASFDLRNNLIIAAGGADKLSAATSFFMQNILSDEDRLVPITKALHEGLVKLGLSADTTILQYKDLVRGQSLATDADQARYLALLDLAPAFKALDDAIGSTTDTVDNAAEIIKKQRSLDIELMEAQGRTFDSTFAIRQDEIEALNKLNTKLGDTQREIYATIDAARISTKQHSLDIELLEALGLSEEALAMKRRDELNSLDAANVATQEAIYAAQDAAKLTIANDKKLADAKGALSTAYDREHSALQSTIDRLKSFTESLKSFRNSLLLGELSPLTPQQKYIESRKQFEATLQAAKGGDVTAQGQLQNAASAFLSASRIANASATQYQTDFFDVQSALKDMSANADTELSVAQNSLRVMETQVTGLININTSVLSVVDAIKALSVLQTNALGLTLNTTPLPISTNVVPYAPKEPLIPDAAMILARQLADGTSSSSGTLSGTGSSSKSSAYIPQLNYQQMGTANMVPLVEEIKKLREEVTTLRSEQKEQTGDLVASNFEANNKAAETIVEGNDNIAKRSVWAQNSGANLE